MTIKKLKNVLFVVTIVLWSTFATKTMAQSYRWAAVVTDSIPKDGFYNLVVQPDMGAKMKTDYSDIRLLDSEAYEVPYVQKTEEPYFNEQQFKEYPIVSKQILENCCTKLVLKNTGKRPINNICLVLKNSDALKVLRIAGSDDGINWFGVDRYSVFYNSFSETDTKVVNYIHFPLTDYLYYQLEITDRGYWDEDRWAYWNSGRWSYPINLLKVGYYETSLKEGKYVPVKTPAFVQADSAAAKQTYIKLVFPDNYTVDRMRFDFEGPRYYKRSAQLARKVVDRKRHAVSFEKIASLELNSYSLNEFDFKAFREREFYLIVNNDDNRPLRLKGVEAWQLTHYLKAYLEKGKKYKLVFGDSLGIAAVYDLGYFTDSIPKILPTLSVGENLRNITDGSDIKREKQRDKRWFEEAVFIWLAIGVIILFLAYMSWRMLEEMKK